MNHLILFVSLLWIYGGPQTPNYYEGYSTAREASRKSGKELVIFFSKEDCSNCEAAWVAFSKDVKATQEYVSTRMDIEDFDGGVFFELLELKQVPSWICFHPDGTEKERWEGGWKDATGNPILFDQTAPSPTIAAQKKIITPNREVTSNSLLMNDPSEKKVANTHPSKSTSAPNIQPQKTGFVIQTGYFGSEGNAKKMVSDLDHSHFTSFEIKVISQNGTNYYRVISKVFASASEAAEFNERLAQTGIRGSVKKTSEL